MAEKNKGDEVLTPGGKRQRSAVHEVKPGEVVTGEGANPTIQPDTQRKTPAPDAGHGDLVLT
ncbi:MAG TPA: hypothetical protein VGJ82_14610, partial [Thermoanaerobaculia bacterium]